MLLEIKKSNSGTYRMDCTTSELICNKSMESGVDFGDLSSDNGDANDVNENVDNKEIMDCKDSLEIIKPEAEMTNKSAVSRVDDAILKLRHELTEMQKQDVSLLRQLMQIHATISILNGSRHPHRRSASSSSLHPLDSPPSQDHTPLRRERSEPVRRPPLQRSSTTEEPPVTELEEDIDDGGPLCHSFNDFSSSGESTSWLASMDSSLPSSPHPIPTFFRGKRCSTIVEEQHDHGQNEEVKPERLSLCSTGSNMSHMTDDIFEDHVINVDESYVFNPANGLVTSLIPDLPDNSKTSEYEVHYEGILKRSSKLWREIKQEQEESGVVDKKKIATLKLFL